VPGKKHGSGTGDRWHGGKGNRYDVPLTPLGRFSKFFVTGPNRIPFFNEESSDDDSKVVAEPEGEERLGKAIAIEIGMFQQESGLVCSLTLRDVLFLPSARWLVECGRA
jgi:hypothetical protein